MQTVFETTVSVGKNVGNPFLRKLDGTTGLIPSLINYKTRLEKVFQSLHIFSKLIQPI